jgi:hypothetical protein
MEFLSLDCRWIVRLHRFGKFDGVDLDLDSGWQNY